MLPSFVHTYRNDQGLGVLYFYPGYDDNGRIVNRLDFTDSSIDYKFSKGSDKALEYTFLNPSLDVIEYNLVNLPQHSSQLFRVFI